MYTKHHTKGLVLTAWNSGESDRVYSILTPDLGKVYAKAKGVREHKARHKAFLQPLSQADVSLVRAKSGWRITNVSPRHSLYTPLSNDKQKLFALTRVLRLVTRFLAGEGHARDVFGIVEAFSEAMLRSEMSLHDMKIAETLAVARIMHVLGYLKEDVKLAPFLSDIEDMSAETLRSFGTHEKRAVPMINEAILATQM